MEYKEFKSLIIAMIVMIATLGALCTAIPAMAEGDSLPEVSDQVITNMSVKDIQDFDMIEIDPDPLAYNESLKNSSADFEVCDSAISGKIVGVTITPTRLVSNQYVTYSVYVKNTGTINTCYQLEYYSNGVHVTSGFERWINPGDTETFSWRRTMGSTGDREYIFKLYWDRVWYEGSNVLLDTVIVDRYCFAAGLPDIYEPDDSSSYATVIYTNGEAQYHDFHDSGDGDWVKFYMEPGDVCTIETTAIGDRADTYLAFCYYKDFAWHYIYNDDGGVGHGSKIVHTCTHAGDCYVKVRQYNSGVYGETTSYSISVSAGRDRIPGTPFLVGGHVYLGTAIVSGAEVTVTNLDTTEFLTTTTDSNGAYVVSLGNLAIGHRAGDIIHVTARYNGIDGWCTVVRAEQRSENISDSPQIIDVTTEVQIKAWDGGELPATIPVGEIFTIMITKYDIGMPVGAGAGVAFMLPYDTGYPLRIRRTDDDGKARYTPLITGTLGIKVLDGTGTTVAEATVEVGTAAAPSVTRDLPVNTSAGAPITVSLVVDVQTGATYYGIDEIVPSGWTVTSATDGGDYTSTAGHVMWAVTSGAADKVYSYTVDVPAVALGTYMFDGIYAFEGMAAEATIIGDTAVMVVTGVEYDSADTNHDCVVSMMELMTQIGKWKSGDVGMMELMTSIGRWKLGAGGYC